MYKLNDFWGGLKKPKMVKKADLNGKKYQPMTVVTDF